MAYSLYHIISTTVLESNSTLDTLKEYVYGAELPFSKEEIIEMIDCAMAHNNKLYKSANLVRQDISEEIF